MISITHRSIRTLLVVGALLGSSFATPSSAFAVGERWWVFLPRTVDAGPESIDGLPYPPTATERALVRRSLRGRADRVALLSRGPDPAAVRAALASGAQIRAVSRWLSAISVEADEPTLARLRARFGHRAVRPVRTLRGERDLQPSAVPVPALGRRDATVFDYGPSAAQLAQIQVDALHARGFTGNGVRILVLDTGFWLDHPAFAQLRVVDEYDFVFEDGSTANDPEQDSVHQHRHGTGVLGVVAGLDEGHLVGVAPGAEVLLAKTEWVLTETRVEEDAFVRALEWGEALGADVMTASLGYRVFADEPDSFAYAPEDFDGDTAVTTRAVDDLVALGVLAVTSAGNAGPSPATLLTPADADSVITVGAVDSLGVIAAFSSRGPTADGRTKPDLVARGRLTVWAETLGADYAAVNGTSLSAPLVAGSVALVLEAHPDWGPGAVIDALRGTASQAGSPDNAMGWGIVRAADAIFGVTDPQWPLPFGLIEPGDGASVSTSTTPFRWRRAVDLQTSAQVDYAVQLALDESFAEIVASYDAGGDTVRTLEAAPLGTFVWRVLAVDPDGHERYSASRTVTFTQPTSALVSAPSSGWSGAWPNPTPGASRLRLRLGEAAQARIEVFDLAGRRVRTLVGDANLPRGDRILEWDGRDDTGRPAASGAYFVRARLTGPSGVVEQVSTRITVVR